MDGHFCRFLLLLFFISTVADAALNTADASEEWSAVQKFDFLRANYQAFVPIREAQSVSVDFGFHGDKQAEQPNEVHGSLGGGLDPEKLREVAKGLADRSNVDVVLGRGIKEIKAPRRSVRGSWTAGFNATVDVKTGGVLIRVSPKFTLAGKKFRWTIKEVNSRARRIRGSVTAGSNAEKALPGMRSQYNTLMRAANDRDNVRNRAAGGQAYILSKQIAKAEKAYRILDASETSLAAITGVGEFGDAIVRRQGFVGVRIRINGRLIKLDENWQPTEIPEQSSELAQAQPRQQGSGSPISAGSTLRTWRSADGKTEIRAAFLRRDGDLIRIRRVDGKEFNAPLARFSAEDVKWVLTNAPAS